MKINNHFHHNHPITSSGPQSPVITSTPFDPDYFSLDHVSRSARIPISAEFAPSRCCEGEQILVTSFLAAINSNGHPQDMHRLACHRIHPSAPDSGSLAPSPSRGRPRTSAARTSALLPLAPDWGLEDRFGLVPSPSPHAFVI